MPFAWHLAPWLVVVAITGAYLVDWGELAQTGTWQQFYRIDLDVYRSSAIGLLAGRDLYESGFELARGDELPFTYPPFAALVFIPLATLPLAASTAAFCVISVGALAGCVGACVAAGAPHWPTSSKLTATGWACVTVLISEPVMQTLNFGQVNIVLATLVLADAALLTRTRFAGVAIGAAIAIKLTPAVFLAVPLVLRRWSVLARSIVAAAGFTALGWWASPSDSLRYWTETLFDSDRIGALAYAGNQSLRGLLERIAPADANAATSWLWLIGSAVVVSASYLALVRLRRAAALPRAAELGRAVEDAERPAGAGAQSSATRSSAVHTVPLVLWASLIALVCSPVSWSHHFVWLPLTAVYLAMRALAGCYEPGLKRITWALAAVVAVVTNARLHWLVPHGNNAEFAWSWWQHVLGNSYLWLSLGLIAAAICFPRAIVGGWTATTRVSQFL